MKISVMSTPSLLLNGTAQGTLDKRDVDSISVAEWDGSGDFAPDKRA